MSSMGKRLCSTMCTYGLMVVLAGCGGGGSGGEEADQTSAPAQPTSPGLPPDGIDLPTTGDDQDLDGIPDAQDLWPTDANRPITSSLWGIEGERWDTAPQTSGIQSRLPFFGLAGYRDGTLPPRPACTLSAQTFGAFPDDQLDDTDALWHALAQARVSSSVSAPAVLCLEAGTYLLKRQLHLNVSGLVVRGAGRMRTTLKFEQGMIAQTYPEFIGNVTHNWDGNKAIVLGSGGRAWRDMVLLNALPDLGQLPRMGDLHITLPTPLSANQQALLSDSGYRVRLKQAAHYSNREPELHTPIFTAGLYGGPNAAHRVAQSVSQGTFLPQYNEFTPMKFLAGFNTYVQGHYDEYKYGHGQETAYQEFVVTYVPGSTTLLLDRPVRFDMTYEDDRKRPKLQVLNTTTAMDLDIGIEDLTIEFPATPWKDCTGALAGYPCDEGLAAHSGYWAQGGIEIRSDFSWARNIRFRNAGNPIHVSGHFNTVTGLVIDSERPTSEGVAKSTSPTDSHTYLKTAVTGHVGVKVAGIDNLIDDVIIRANFHHTVSLANAHGNVLSNIRAEQPAAHPTDSDGRPYVKINLDHHRQIIYANLWTDIHLGGSHRMWASTGDITEGFNVAAYNTYWGLHSDSPEIDYWPHNRVGSVEWGYHFINIVGTHIADKPPAPQHTSIDDLPYPYPNKNPELNPFPYHPSHAHLESTPPSEVWPQNLYQAQRQAYLACRLAFQPSGCP